MADVIWPPWPKTVVKLNRFLRRWFSPGWHPSAPNPVFAEALGRWAAAPSDMRDHLWTIFREVLLVRPRLIVELGTRGGVSTRALLAAAEISDAQLLSVDVVDCAGIDLVDRFRRRWSFVQSDDVLFAGEPFDAFCRARGLAPLAQAILVDTSHSYEHTRHEIDAWMPRLDDPGVMLFHDTNSQGGWYRCLDGRVEPGLDSPRPVMRALEEFLGRRYDERSFFTDVVDGYIVQHMPWSSGLLSLHRQRGGHPPTASGS
jgi:hypothetical protein